MSGKVHYIYLSIDVVDLSQTYLVVEEVLVINNLMMRIRWMSASTTPMSTPRLPVLLPSNKAKKHVGEGQDDFSSRFQSASN